MSLLDFLYPEHAQAMHLREIAETSRSMLHRQRASESDERANRQEIKSLARRVGKLEEDLALMAMVNVLLVRSYIEATGSDLPALQERMREIDRSDGVADGGLDLDEFRRVLGLQLAQPETDADATDCLDCGRPLLMSQPKCLYCGWVRRGS